MVYLPFMFNKYVNDKEPFDSRREPPMSAHRWAGEVLILRPPNSRRG